VEDGLGMHNSPVFQIPTWLLLPAQVLSQLRELGLRNLKDPGQFGLLMSLSLCPEISGLLCSEGVRCCQKCLGREEYKEGNPTCNLACW
jgi:hypothetical protein